MKLSLVVLSEGKAKGQTIPITLSQFVIGRDPQCNLRPASALISKRHCALLVKNGQVFIRDFESTNGTFVNEDPVKGERGLANGDTLRVGPLTFRVVMEIPTSAATKQTPVPAPAKTAAGSDDDSVAAMLLALGDDTPAGLTSDLKDNVPGGSTVMDIAPVPTAETPKPGDSAKTQDAAKKPDKAKQMIGNTSSAAKAILEKYSRRSRS